MFEPSRHAAAQTTGSKVAVVMASLMAVFLCSCEQKAGGSTAKPSGKDSAAPQRNVTVIRATVSPQERTVQAVGSLAALDQTTLSTKVAGRLKTLAVDLGDQVHQKQVLAEVESRDYELRVRQTEAMLAQARVRLGLPLQGESDAIEPEQTSTLREAQAVLTEARKNQERVTQLSEQGILSQSERETVDSAYQVALSRYQDAIEEVRNRQALVAQRRVEVEIARQQLADTVLYAPFDGAVQQRLARPGEYLSASSPVVTVVRIDPLRLQLEISERQAGLIKLGQSVRINLEGHPKPYSGKISRLSPIINPRNRMLQIEAEVPNPGTLRPGAFARSEIVVDANVPMIVLPKAALSTFAGIEKVFIVQQGKAVEKHVTTGKATGEHVEILHGVEEGDLVVLDPGNLIPGQPVQIARDS